MPVPNLLGFTAPVKAEGWAVMTLGPGPLPARYDLCEDCAEVLVEQFMVGANVHAITQPPGMNVLPHDNVPYQDCLLAFDPDAGKFVCEHDDPERFLKLQRDRAQNVAEGVPEQVVPGIPEWAEKKRGDELVSCPVLQGGCGGRLPARHLEQHMSEVHGIKPLRERAAELVADVHTSGWAHSIVQRCGDACSEQHTYTSGCLLDGVVQPADGRCRYCQCTAHNGLACSSTGCSCQVSTQGEDLTEAYSEQEAAE